MLGFIAGNSSSIQFILLIGSGLLAMVSTIAFFLVRSALASDTRVDRRLLETEPVPVDQSGPLPSRLEQSAAWLKSLGQRSGGGDIKRMSEMKRKLQQAGFKDHNAPLWYFGARTLALVLSQLSLFTIWPLIAPFAPHWGLTYAAVGLAVAVVVGPTLWLDRRIAARAREAQDGFPDMMDLMVACIEAGLSLDAAIQCVANEISGRFPVLSDQLNTTILELRAGKSRQEAIQRFASRVGFSEAQSLATMLRQSEEMGSSLGATLRAFADDMRVRRMLMAEEKAMALPAKLTVPLILFIFPTIIGVVMLPAAYKLMNM